MKIDHKTLELLIMVNSNSKKSPESVEIEKDTETTAEKPYTIREIIIVKVVKAAFLLLVVIPGYRCWDHVFRTFDLFNRGIAFPKGWVAYDTIMCIVHLLLIFLGVSLYVAEDIYEDELRRGEA